MGTLAIVLAIVEKIAPPLFTYIASAIGMNKANDELLAAYPQIPPEMVKALLVSLTAKSDAGLQKFIADMEADQAAHPVVPK